MPNYTYTQLSNQDVLYIEIDGKRFAVAQFNASFAVNEIPQAQCYLAVGRDTRPGIKSTVSSVHEIDLQKPMTKAKVFFKPEGQYSERADWPAGTVVIFDGYFLGAAYRKTNGTVSLVVRLVHWLVDMTCSSCLAGNAHVSNPSQLSSAAVIGSYLDTGTAQSVNIGQAAGAQLMAPLVAEDVWEAIKTLFCKLASLEVNAAGNDGACGGGAADARKNDRALRALKRIEGKGGDCTNDFSLYSVPLRIADVSETVKTSIANALASESVSTYANTSFWDKLVGQMCPSLGMAVVPCVDRAMVVAYLPAFRDGNWRRIVVRDHDSFDVVANLEQPLRGVVVVASAEGQTGAGQTERGRQMTIPNGCYMEDSVEPGDGVIQFVAAPPWLRSPHSYNSYAGETTGLDQDEPAKAAGGDAAGKTTTQPTPETDDLTEFFKKFAHLYYVDNALRGRQGTVSGKLRFDIAPGSIVRIEQNSELFIAADVLASSQVGCVDRVTISISAEQRMAATTLQLSSVRREKGENDSDRLSVGSHPVFGDAIHGYGRHGAPLIPEYEFGVSESPGDVKDNATQTSADEARAVSKAGAQAGREANAAANDVQYNPLAAAAVSQARGAAAAVTALSNAIDSELQENNRRALNVGTNVGNTVAGVSRTLVNTAITATDVARAATDYVKSFF